MRHVKFTTLILLSLTLAFGSAMAVDSPGLSNDPTPREGGDRGSTSMITREDDCNLINFEGVGDQLPIGLVPGPVNVTFGTSWLGLVDMDAGGNGNFANEPSEHTIAFFLDTDDISISLNPPVKFVQFFYSASEISLPVTITAFDANNDIVDTAIGSTIGGGEGSDCVGDPEGFFCRWDVITLDAVADNITSIEITGSVANQFGIDNLQFCTSTQELVSCCRDDLSCVLTTLENCMAADGVVVEDCENADCAAVPSEKSTWGSIKGSYR